MKAVILAGGRGTRLKEVLPDRPKAIAPVSGRPFLYYQLAFLARQGFTDIVLCVGYLHEQIRDYFQDGSSLGVRLTYSVENEPLGTAGALKHAQHLLDETFLVLNGDTYLSVNLEDVINYHAQGPQVATLTLVYAEDAGQYGKVTINQSGYITVFAEKSVPGPGLINAGLYLFDPSVLECIPAGHAASLERETLPLLVEKRLLRGYVVEGYYVDIGTPETYLRAQRELPMRADL